MLHKQFIIVENTNAIVAQGMVEAEAGAGLWLCRFRGDTPASQVIAAAHMTGWLFFDSTKDMANWLARNVRPPVADDDEEAPTGGRPWEPEDLGEDFEPESVLTPDEQAADLAAAK